MNTEVIFRRARVPFPMRPALKAFASRLAEEVAGGRGFRCLISDDRELRRLNRLFLRKDYAADVLSFPEDGASGEIAVSADRAAAQARSLGHSLEVEIRVLMLHGVLHLTGLDHATDRGRMARVETRWRLKFGLPAGLIERANRL
jgi:probable rRNA maturation factor